VIPAADLVRVEEVAPVDEQGVGHSLGHLAPVQFGEFGPLRDEHSGVGIVESVQGRSRHLDRRQQLAGRPLCHRIEGDHGCTLTLQPGGEHQARGLAHVVCVRLEGQPEQRDPLSDQRIQMLRELGHHAPLLKLIHLDHRAEQLEVVAAVAGEDLECLRVLGEAGTSESETGVQKPVADPWVEAHASRHLRHVGADLVADVRDLVDEADLRREVRVRGELDHLGAGKIGPDDRRAERLIDGGDRIGRPLVARVGAHHNPVRLQEVLDGGPLLEKLRARDVGQIGSVPLDGAARADRDGALHDQRLSIRLADLLDRTLDSREIRVSRVGRRRLHADE
jgi:hypothetical protein